MTQRTKVQLGPWLLGAVNRDAAYSALQAPLRRAALLEAYNVQISDTGSLKPRFSLQRVDGFTTTPSQFSDGENLIPYRSVQSADAYLVSVVGNVLYAYDLWSDTWSTIGSVVSGVGPTGISYAQQGSKLYLAGFAGLRPVIVEKISGGWRLWGEGAAGATDNQNHQIFSEISGLWALSSTLPNSVVAIPNTGAAANGEIGATSLPTDTILPENTLESLVAVVTDEEVTLTTAATRRSFYSHKLAVHSDAIDPGFRAFAFVPLFVESFKGRLVFANNRFASPVLDKPNQENRVSFSKANDPRVFFPAAPVLDDSPIDVYLESKGGEIVWLKAHQRFLFVGTQGGLHVFYADVLTPNTATAISTIPASVANIEPAVSESALYYVDESRRRILAVPFDELSQSFRPTVANYWSERLFDVEIEKLLYIPKSAAPLSGLIAVLADGSVFVGAEPRSKANPAEPLSWYKVETDVGIIVNALFLDGEVYFVVRSGASTLLYRATDDPDIAVDEYQIGIADGTGSVTTYLSDGAEVFFVAFNGSDAVASGVATISGGSFNCTAANATCVFGVPFEARAELPPLNVLGAEGYFEGDTYRKLRAQLYLLNTRQLEVEGWPVGDQVPAMPGSVVQPITGYREVDFRGWERDASLSLKQQLGYNFEVATIFVEYEF
ncbi:MAG: hypothetical protein D6816_17025 [Bacteroidetes bacterium]|nr:MAG: hypothetical protein D6816_17025 [Bacteroidota bacterium]